MEELHSRIRDDGNVEPSTKPLAAACHGFLILSSAASTFLAQAPATLDYDSTIKQGTSQLQAGSGDLALACGEAAIRAAPARWEGHALLGRSLLSYQMGEHVGFY